MVRLENQPDAHFHVDAFRLAGLFRKAISYDARVEVSVHSVLSASLKQTSVATIGSNTSCLFKEKERTPRFDRSTVMHRAGCSESAYAVLGSANISPISNFYKLFSNCAENAAFSNLFVTHWKQTRPEI